MPDARRLSLGAALTAGSIAFTATPATASVPELPRNLHAVRHAAPVAPAVSGSAALASFNPSATAPSMTYKVKAGDTVSAIASRTGASVSAIIKANNLNSNALIRIGQVLQIPSPVGAASSSASKPATTTTSKPATTTATTITIKAGDTLGALAAKHKTTVAAIQKANGLTSTVIIAGKTLKIPGTATSSSSSAAKPATTTTSKPTTPSTPTTSHTVKAGDTLGALASKYKTSVAAIKTANKLPSTMIYVGQKLVIPAEASTSTDVPQRVGSTFLHYTYPDHVVAAANVNLDALIMAGVPSRAEMQSLVRQTAIDMGVDPALALGIAMKESAFKHDSVSPANAIGTMQVIPSSGEWASDLVGRQLNLLNPKDNVVAGVAIIRQLVRTAPSLDVAIASYYQGYGSVTRNGMFSDTKQYVAGVKANMATFK